MSAKVEQEVRALFEGTDGEGACVPAPTHRMCVALRRRLGEGGEIVSPERGLYALRDEWEHLSPTQRTLSIMRGMQLMHPGWVFCGPSAALAFGADVSYAQQRPFHVVAPGTSWPARTERVHYHRVGLGGAGQARRRPGDASCPHRARQPPLAELQGRDGRRRHGRARAAGQEGGARGVLPRARGVVPRCA